MELSDSNSYQMPLTRKILIFKLKASLVTHPYNFLP